MHPSIDRDGSIASPFECIGSLDVSQQFTAELRFYPSSPFPLQLDGSRDDGDGGSGDEEAELSAEVPSRSILCSLQQHDPTLLKEFSMGRTVGLSNA